MKYYCIGIKGTGMSALAQILSDLGHEVSGYDDIIEHKYTQIGLEERNIPIYSDSQHSLDPNTIVTYSVAFNENHKEIQRVKRLGLKIKKYNQILGEITEKFESICISGTHGKTTTSSLIKHILENNGGCNYLIGAGNGYATRENKFFVIESDEFNCHFTAYHPTYSVITNIEAEHLECYKDIDDIRNTFEVFANQTSKIIIANGDNQEIKKINYNSKVLFYGFGFNNDIIIKNLNLSENGSRFDIYIKEQLYGSFEVALYGKHMVSDVCSAIIICKEIGIPKDKIIESLKTFKNASRRFAIENIKNTTIIDDYAHHPTEIKVTLEAVKQKYPNKKIAVIFVPNTYSRTKDFKDEFIKAFSIADKAFLTEIDCNREKPEDYPGITSQIITSNLPNSESISPESIEKIKPYLNYVICIMGCAPVEHILTALKNLIINTNNME